MSVEVNFEMIPGRLGGAGRVVNPLTNIRQRVTPPDGPHRDFLVTMGYPFAGALNPAYLTSIISSTYFALESAGLLEVLDWLYLSTGDIDGSVVNIVPGKANTIPNGAVVTEGVITTDGVATFFDSNLAANRANYTLNDAEIFVFLPEAPPNGTTIPIIGNSDGNDAIRLHRNSGAPYLQARVNSSSATITGMTDAAWGRGLFSLARPDANTVRLYKDGTVVAEGLATTATTLATTIVLGRGSTGGLTYAAQGFTSFGGGASLSDPQRAALVSALTLHADFIQQISTP